MEPRIAFYHKKELGNNTVEELHAILLADTADATQVELGSVKLLDGITGSMAEKWVNDAEATGIIGPVVFPVYADEDMLSETAKNVTLGDLDSVGKSKTAINLFGSRILSITPVGETSAYSETAYFYTTKVPAGPFWVSFEENPERLREFLVLEYALSYAQMQARLLGGTYTIHATDENDQNATYGKVSGVKTENSQVCNVHYLTQPVEGAQPIGALSIIR